MTTKLHSDRLVAARRDKWLEFLSAQGRKKWQRALESGSNREYRCCLGHACHRFYDNLELSRFPGGDHNTVGYANYADGERMYGGLPTKVAKYLDITINCEFTSNDTPVHKKWKLPENVQSAMALNDFTDYDMATISKILREMFVGGYVVAFSGRGEDE